MIQNLLLLFVFLAALPSCAVIGKAKRQEIDRRSNGGNGDVDDAWSERFTITGKIRTERSERENHYIILPDWKTRRENPWFSWPEGHPERGFDLSARYRIELIEHVRDMRDSSGDRQYRHVEVEWIETIDGVTILDARVCPVHNQHMRWDWETAGSSEAYGTTPYFKIQEKKFPHDGRVYLACGSGYYRQKRWICHKCETACDQTVKRLGIVRY